MAIKLLAGRDPAAMPLKDFDAEMIVESTGAFNLLDSGSTHVEAGARKVVLTAQGKNRLTRAVGVSVSDCDAATTRLFERGRHQCGTATACKVLDESSGARSGMTTMMHSYTSDQIILDSMHCDLRRAHDVERALGVSLRVPTPFASIVDLAVRVGKSCTTEVCNGAIKAMAEDPLKGIGKCEEEPLASSDLMQTDYSTCVDAALTVAKALVMKESSKSPH